MTVYVEYALLENMLVDCLLLTLALKTARVRISWWRLLLASAVGGIEALAFPLVPLPIVAAYAVKLLGGALLVLFSGRWNSIKAFLIALVSFFLYTFALGGLLVAIYSFFQIEYLSQGGYLVESAPVGLIVGGAGCFFLGMTALIKRAFIYRRVQRCVVACQLTHRAKSFSWKGMVDSGNGLYFKGEAVSVISPTAAYLLFGKNTPYEGTVSAVTVSGTRDMPLVRCDKITIEGVVKEGALFAVAPVRSNDYQMILHTAWMEDKNGNVRQTQTALTEDKDR